MSDQMDLLPEKMPTARMRSILLHRFPEDLPGPEPSKKFIENINRFTVIFPVIVIDHGAGKLLEVVDGRRRIKAARKLEFKRIPAKVYEADGLESASAIMSISLNLLRSSNPVAEYKAILRLLEEGATQEEIRRATGLSKGTVDKRLRLAGLDKELLEGMDRGDISTSVGEAAAKLPEPAQARLVEQFDEAEKLTMKDVKEERSARATNELEQIPAAVFSAPEGQWWFTVSNRLTETAKLVPEDHPMRSVLETMAGELMDLRGE